MAPPLSLPSASGARGLPPGGGLPASLSAEDAALGTENGVLVLSSITGGERTVHVPADAINQSFVLCNRLMLGTVNAGKDAFEQGVRDLIHAEAAYPGWLEQLLTEVRPA